MQTIIQYRNKLPQEKVDDLIVSLVDFRNFLRSRKNYDFADKIRDMLTSCGVQVTDGRAL